MACRLVGANHYLNQCRYKVYGTHGYKFQRTVNRNLYIFIPENAFENVVMQFAAILSRPECDDTTIYRLRWYVGPCGHAATIRFSWGGAQHPDSPKMTVKTQCFNWHGNIMVNSPLCNSSHWGQCWSHLFAVVVNLNDKMIAVPYREQISRARMWQCN